MKSETFLLTKFFTATLVTLAVLMAGPAQAKPSWTQLGSSYFPSRVKAIVFPSGRAIDGTNGVCWGKWCLNFGADAPVATFTQCCPSINISGLVCTNSVVGRKSCRIYLINAPDIGLDCNIFGDDIRLRIAIRCPQGLRLE